MRFRTLLTVYEADEEQARITLGRLEHERMALADEVARIAKESETAAVGVGLLERELLVRFQLVCASRLNQAKGKLKLHDQTIETARGALTEAHRKTLTIRQLQTRDALALLQQHQRRDQRLNDEFAARRVLLSGNHGKG